MKRYLSIFFAFFQTGLVADLEYRANLSVKVLTDIFWYIAQVSTFEILYTHTNQLGGWQVEHMRVFLTLLFLVDALYMLFFSENLDMMGSKIMKGEMDFLLTKPINAQFMSSFYRINTAYIVNLLLVSTLFMWSLCTLRNGVPWSRLPLLLLTIPASLAVMYFSKLIFALSAVFFGANTSISLVWYQIYRLATRPDFIYPRALRYVILTIVPMAFIASVPARILLDAWNPWLLVISVALGIVMLWASRWYWNFAMSRYASASS